MNEALGAVQSLGSVAATTATVPTQLATANVEQADFSGWVSTQVASLNTQMVQAELGVQQLASGESTSLHEVMIRMEESRLAFQFAVQVRNRVIEAYQEVLRLQV